MTAPPETGRESALPGRGGTGVAALGCFAASAGVYLWKPGEEAVWAAFLRVGIALSALWLALPTAERPGPWGGWSPRTALFVVGCLVLSARFPLFGLPLLGGWLFWRWLKTPPPRTTAE